MVFDRVAAEEEEIFRSGSTPKRSFSLTNLISDFIHGAGASGEKKQQESEGGMKREWSSSGSLDTLLPRKCPYAACRENPSVPFEFRMPLHYPRFSEVDYKAMEEPVIDRLLEEYGLPAGEMGSLEEKREYAIGAFLFKN